MSLFLTDMILFQFLMQGSLNGVPQVASVSKIAGTQQSLIKDFGSAKDNVTKNRVFLLGENRWEEPSRLVKSVQSGNERNPTSTSAKCLTCRGEKRLMCVGMILNGKERNVPSLSLICKSIYIDHRRVFY